MGVAHSGMLAQTSVTNNVLTLTFDLDNETLYLNRLFVVNIDSNIGTMLLENGCSVNQALMPQQPQTNQSTVSIEFNSAKYSESNFVRFVGTIKNCHKTPCERLDCSSGSTVKEDAKSTKVLKHFKSQLIELNPDRMDREVIISKVNLIDSETFTVDDLFYGCLLFASTITFLSFIIFWLRKVFCSTVSKNDEEEIIK